MRAFTAISLCAAAAILGGCVQPRSSGAGPSAENSPNSAARSPFVPRSMRIYSLTRVEKDAAGKRLLCYIEFQDAWGDTAKAVGVLRVALFRPSGVEPGMDRESQSWEIDLNDLDRNARLFDPATRTYRLSLRDVPEWLDEQAPALLRASFYSDGSPLSAELRLSR